MISTFLSKPIHHLDHPIESERKKHKSNMHEQSKNQRHPHFEEPMSNSEAAKQNQYSYNTGTASHNPTHGTFTPITQTHSHEFALNHENKFDVEMITEESFAEKPNNREELHHHHHHPHKEEEEVVECPCGHMHGPGQGTEHDIHAVGMAAVPLLRGPD